MQKLGGRNRYNVFLGKEYSQVDADGATEFLHHFAKLSFGSICCNSLVHNADTNPVSHASST